MEPPTLDKVASYDREQSHVPVIIDDYMQVQPQRDRAQVIKKAKKKPAKGFSLRTLNVKNSMTAVFKDFFSDSKATKQRNGSATVTQITPGGDPSDFGTIEAVADAPPLISEQSLDNVQQLIQSLGYDPKDLKEGDMQLIREYLVQLIVDKPAPEADPLEHLQQIEEDPNEMFESLPGRHSSGQERRTRSAFMAKDAEPVGEDEASEQLFQLNMHLYRQSAIESQEAEPGLQSQSSLRRNNLYKKGRRPQKEDPDEPEEQDEQDEEEELDELDIDEEAKLEVGLDAQIPMKPVSEEASERTTFVQEPAQEETANSKLEGAQKNVLQAAETRASDKTRGSNQTKRKSEMRTHTLRDAIFSELNLKRKSTVRVVKGKGKRRSVMIEFDQIKSLLPISDQVGTIAAIPEEEEKANQPLLPDAPPLPSAFRDDVIPPAPSTGPLLPVPEIPEHLKAKWIPPPKCPPCLRAKARIEEMKSHIFKLFGEFFKLRATKKLVLQANGIPVPPPLARPLPPLPPPPLNLPKPGAPPLAHSLTALLQAKRENLREVNVEETKKEEPESDFVRRNKDILQSIRNALNFQSYQSAYRKERGDDSDSDETSSSSSDSD